MASLPWLIPGRKHAGRPTLGRQAESYRDLLVRCKFLGKTPEKARAFGVE